MGRSIRGAEEQRIFVDSDLSEQPTPPTRIDGHAQAAFMQSILYK